ncbi:NB-ARC domains-containing protein [Artemisia annua]|uniref:NB-ARC domains-containing protein n=1 Tax=Artemisia annua TaxID=35608 RepID=A0A2U1MD60_ARTAN|nr:NB-ARC domains-containing protein [Artemisia annua]
MATADIELFMTKLRWLLYDDTNDLVRTNPLIKAKKPDIQLLYEELGSLIDLWFKYWTNNQEQLHELEDLGSWKRELTDVAREAEDIIDVFISYAILNNNIKGSNKRLRHDTSVSHGASVNWHTYSALEAPSCFSPGISNGMLDYPLNLKYVMDSIKSIGKEMSNMKCMVNNKTIQQFVKKDMMNKKSQATRSSCSIHTATVKQRAAKHEEVIVGFDADALSIIDRLTGGRKQLDIISIVGMGGLGKTTLATKIYNDQYAVYYFDIRGWISVSQAYSKRDLLIQILVSIGKTVHDTTSEPKVCEMLYKSLKGRKYLIVIDDIWSAAAWDDLRLCFPDDKTGSRVLLTTRLAEVACHANRGSFTHNLQLLSEEKSWELLCRKTFRGVECPEKLIETGKHIARECQGLPLALVVIAGLLEKAEKTKDLWESVVKRVSSYIVNDPEGCLDVLALSYDHLPCHLRNCFLYISGFPKDGKIQVQRLIRLWMAEGFIKEAGQRSMEEEAEDYLMDLVDRNLLAVADRRSDGGIKSCHLHDLLRELCLKKANEEGFFKKITVSYCNSFSTSSIKKQRRLITDFELLCSFCQDSPTHIRSVLCFHYGVPSVSPNPMQWELFLLLRVLDLLNFPIINSGMRLGKLVHLKYLAVWFLSKNIDYTPSEDYCEFSISKAYIWSLQTLILRGKFQVFKFSGENIANTVNLRHLRCDNINISIYFGVPLLLNLQTVSTLRLDCTTISWQHSFPNIKKLGCSVSSTSSDRAFLNFAMLTHLQALNLQNDMDIPLPAKNPITFPETLKNLALKGCRLPWIYMSTIQRLPKLEVLKLLDSSFEGDMWDVGNYKFIHLKLLKLQKLKIKSWEASSINFPNLRKLVVKTCKDLKEIPLVLGNISTLEHIEIDYSNILIRESVNRIQEEQHAMGNYDIHVTFSDIDPCEVFFEGNPYYD